MTLNSPYLEAEADSPVEVLDLSTARVMIVDDEPINIKAVKKYLEYIGYRHFTCTTESPETLELVRRHRPDVILLDIMMPEVTGLEILRSIRAHREFGYIPVLILTAYCDSETRREALEAGATDFLAKPVDPSELLPRVRNALAVKRHHDGLRLHAQQLEGEVQQRGEELLATKQQAVQRYLAGKAEIATEVIHNVGNALHSINTAIDVIRELLDSSKSQSLAKVAGLLAENRDCLDIFLTQNDKGRLIPDYLDELSAQLTRERAATMREVETVVKHLGHIQAIINTQQKYAGSASVHESVDLATLLSDAEALCSVPFEAKGIRVERNFFPASSIRTDEQKLLQVFVNLLKNAAQAMDQGGQLTLNIRPHDSGSITVSLTDNGCGIAKEHLLKIFNHGFTTRNNGHGFGLHSCANIVKELGGSLSATSDGPGKGATFNVVLPVV